MKKISLLVLIFILFIPIIVNACPHFDEDGRLYLLYYDAEDYDIMIIEYPKNYYHQIYHYDADENMIAENFEIPFFTPMQIDYEVDVFMPVSDDPYYVTIDELSVTGEKVRLDVGFSSTKEQLMPKINDDLSRLSYYVNTKLINEDMHSNIYRQIADYTDDMPVESLGLDIFYIGAAKKTMDYQWRTSERVIRDFWDPVKVYYPVPDDLEKFTLLQIESFNREVIQIREIDFMIEDNYIVFTANSESYFQVAYKTDDFDTKEIVNEDYEIDEKIITKDEKSPSITGIIILSVIGILLFAGVLIVISKKQIKVT